MTTTVDGEVNFSNPTYVALTAANAEIQNEVQISTADEKTTTQEGPFFTTHETHFSYPFKINLTDTFLADGDVPQMTSIDQQHESVETSTLGGFPIYHPGTSNELTTPDSTGFLLENGG